MATQKQTDQPGPKRTGTNTSPLSVPGLTLPLETPSDLPEALQVKKPDEGSEKPAGGSPKTVREELLDNALTDVQKVRQEQYGDPQVSLGRIAAIWSAILGHRVTEKQVAIMMAGMNLARLAFDPDDFGLWSDLAGDAAIGAEVIETGL